MPGVSCPVRVSSTQVARDWTWTRCYLVESVSSGNSVLIDPSTVDDREREHLRSRLLPGPGRGRVLAVVLTHGHPDHICDAEYWADQLGAPLAGNEADLPLMTDPVLNASRALGRDIFLARDRLDLSLGEGDLLELDAGGPSLTVLGLPGHSPGSIGLRWTAGPGEGPGFVISGDILFQGSVGTDSIPGHGPLWGASLEAEIETIRKRLLVLPDDTVIHPGHGPSTTVGEERAHNPFLA
ncbi:MBL fold metallo-hydrolase [Candidatus Fermentibacterales bacterium]|nr:MBL fold metallo-hydrolase [Candidatus Fermentibacterales bacterium]